MKKLPKMHYIYLFKSSSKARQVTNSMTTYTQKATEQRAQGTGESQWPPYGSQSTWTYCISGPIPSA